MKGSNMRTMAFSLNLSYIFFMALFHFRITINLGSKCYRVIALYTIYIYTQKSWRNKIIQRAEPTGLTGLTPQFYFFIVSLAGDLSGHSYELRMSVATCTLEPFRCLEFYLRRKSMLPEDSLAVGQKIVLDNVDGILRVWVVEVSLVRLRHVRRSTSPRCLPQVLAWLQGSCGSCPPPTHCQFP